MKKKVLIGLLSLMMVFTTACGSANDGGGTSDGPTPYERLEAANSAYEDSESMAMDFYMEMDMEVEGESLMTYIMNGDIRINAEDENNVEFSMVTKNDIEMMGTNQAMDMTAYYRDGYYYMSVDGQQFKMLMPLEDAMDQTAVSNVDFEEQAILSQKADGNVLTFVIKGESMTEFFDDMMGEMMAAFGDDANLSYDDVTYVAHLSDNDELEKMEMEISMAIEVMGESATANAKVIMDVKEVGSSVTVDFPDDLDTYMEIDSSLLGL